MEALSVREYRNNLAASFTKADNGEQVLIRRKNETGARGETLSAADFARLADALGDILTETLQKH